MRSSGEVDPRSKSSVDEIRQRFDADVAIADAMAMVAAGADLVDVGGESTRPGADPLPVEEEWRRVGPVLEGLRGRIDEDAVVLSGARLRIRVDKERIVIRDGRVAAEQLLASLPAGGRFAWQDGTLRPR